MISFIPAKQQCKTIFCSQGKLVDDLCHSFYTWTSVEQIVVRLIVLFFYYYFFFYLGFLSQPFTNHRTAGEGGGYFFNYSLPLPPASQTLAGRLLQRAQLCTQAAAGPERNLFWKCGNLLWKSIQEVRKESIVVGS